MRTFDLTPLFRSSIGFDRFSDLIDTAMREPEQASAYPPYNIEKHSEDRYRIVLALAGFRESDLTITVQENQLTVAGRQEEPEAGRSVQYLHKGIATRNFERKFSLADHVKVVKADFRDGLLFIDLQRELPESVKPRMIAINGAQAPTIDGKKVN